MDMLYPNYMQPSLWNSFPMNSGLPANKFGGGLPVSGSPPQFMQPLPGMGLPQPLPGVGINYWDEAGNEHWVGGQPNNYWSPNLLPPPPMVSIPTPVPTDPSVPPPAQEDPWIGPDTEEAQKYHDRVKQMSEDFYRNNPEHFLSKIDSKVRSVFGMPQLGNTLNMGQGITPQTNWPGQGVTPQIQPQPIQTAVPQTDYGTAPFGTMDIPNAQGDLNLMDANSAVRRANERRASQAQENARIAAARNRNRQKAAAARTRAKSRSAEGAGRDGGSRGQGGSGMAGPGGGPGGW